MDIATAMLEQGKYENVKRLINVLKSEDPKLGGEKFQSRFQELSERSFENLTKTSKISQNLELEPASGLKEKK